MANDGRHQMAAIDDASAEMVSGHGVPSASKEAPSGIANRAVAPAARKLSALMFASTAATRSPRNGVSVRAAAGRMNPAAARTVHHEAIVAA